MKRKEVYALVIFLATSLVVMKYDTLSLEYVSSDVQIKFEAK